MIHTSHADPPTAPLRPYAVTIRHGKQRERIDVLASHVCEAISMALEIAWDWRDQGLTIKASPWRAAA